MNFTLCTENKVFPYMLVDDFYTTEEQDLIWEELEYYRKENLYSDGKFPGSYGVSSVANLNRVYLEGIYPNNREDSNILTVYKKILSPEVLENYRHTTPAARQFENTNNDCSLVGILMIQIIMENILIFLCIQFWYGFIKNQKDLKVEI